MTLKQMRNCCLIKPILFAYASVLNFMFNLPGSHCGHAAGLRVMYRRVWIDMDIHLVKEK